MASREQAHLACIACKARKRKCDKELPQCSLCASKGATCTYPSQQLRRGQLRDLSETPHSLSPQSSTSVVVATPDHLPAATSPTTNEFPPVFYLDFPVFQQCTVDFPRSDSTIPSYISKLIGNNSNWKAVASEYFATAHKWMPIISKKRFNEHVFGVPPHQLRSDYALIILCMQLITWVPRNRTPRCPTYLAAKSYYLELEIEGIVSLRALQAGVIIAIFEFGHAIYPSAAVSIDACIRYARTLGIAWDSISTTKQPFSWVDLEEQTRVWWAIVMMDRFVTQSFSSSSLTTFLALLLTNKIRVRRIGHSSLPTSIGEPIRNIFLPSDDASWDEGIMPTKRLAALLPHSTEDPGRFTMASETARLLGQVLQHIEADIQDTHVHEEALLLDRALRALHNVVELKSNVQELNMLDITSMCSIALLILHEAHATAKTALSGYFDKIHRTKFVTTELLGCLTDQTEEYALLRDAHIKESTPLIGTMLYQSACANLRIRNESPCQETVEALALTKRALKSCDFRWKSSGAYLKILEAKELAHIH